MESNDAWQQRWEAGQTGFHQDVTNPLLVKYWASRVSNGQAKVLVPLCGKSADMVWLARRGHSVLGVEVVELACQSFFAEQEIPFETRQEGGFTVFASSDPTLRIELWCGDFFTLSRTDVGELGACFDRAALVALPPEVQLRYAAHLATLLPEGAEVLTVTFGYPQAERQGPPFSVTGADVTRLFADSFDVDLLEDLDLTETDNRWEFSSLVQSVVGLARKGSGLLSPGLAGFQRKFLRGLAHNLRPIVQVGKAGVTDEVIQTIDRALEDHELIKVSMHKPKDKKGMSAELASASGAELCGLLGHTAILYRAREKKPGIRLPSS